MIRSAQNCKFFSSLNISSSFSYDELIKSMVEHFLEKESYVYSSKFLSLILWFPSQGYTTDRQTKTYIYILAYIKVLLKDKFTEALEICQLFAASSGNPCNTNFTTFHCDRIGRYLRNIWASQWDSTRWELPLLFQKYSMLANFQLSLRKYFWDP